MSKVSGGGAARRGMKTEEDAMQRLAISTQARGRASKANKSPPHAARLTRGAAMRLAETEATSDDDMDSEGSPTQATGGRWGSRDQGHLPAAPPPHLLLSAKKSNRPPPIVVSEKAAALGRHLIMNPLLGPQMSDGGHNSRCSSRGPSASPATPAAAAISACAPAPSMGAHARTAYESRRKAARAIAAAVAAGPAARLTRSQHAALEAGGSAKHRPMDRITETPPSASALAEAAARGHPVSIALPPCVPSIDRAALSFEPSASRTLGSGSYGIVYEGRYMGQPVAVKVQELSLQNQDDLDELSVEAVLGSSLHHPGLLRTMAASVYSFPGPTGRGAQPSSPRHEVHMVMELMPDGNALAVFEGRSCLDLATLLLAANIAEQVAWALDFLHSSCGMLHLDVKGANVLVRLDDTRTASVVAKLADFGLTVKRHDAINEEGGMRDRGTPRYMGPEFWDDDLAECIGEAADVYALGCVMWEMASRGAAFLADRSDAQVARAKGKASVPMPTGTAHLDKYSALAQRCRCVNPDDRPRVRDVALELKALCEKLRARLRLP